MALGLMLTFCLAGADEIELRPDYPEKYIVEKGDTLWDIIWPVFDQTLAMAGGLGGQPADR